MEKGDFEEIIRMIYERKYLPKDTVKQICEKSIELLSKLPNVVSIHPPVTVCGDIDGQLFDLFELFEVGGKCPDTNYIFLGDYANSDVLGMETFLLLLVLELRYPNRITLLRGHHDDRDYSRYHSLYDEVIRKYCDVEIWHFFINVFDVLPLCAIIGGRIFCTHSGLSPQLQTIDQIQRIYRKKNFSDSDIVSNLLWAEPENITGFQKHTHGYGFLFGENNVDEFNRTNKTNLIISSRFSYDGYTEWFNGKLYTIWSAPNHKYRTQNLAAILEVDQCCKTKLKTFESAPTSVRFEIHKKI